MASESDKLQECNPCIKEEGFIPRKLSCSTKTKKVISSLIIKKEKYMGSRPKWNKM